MLATKPDKEHHVPNIFKAIKIAQSPEFQEALKETEEHETISQDEKDVYKRQMQLRKESAVLCRFGRWRRKSRRTILSRLQQMAEI